MKNLVGRILSVGIALTGVITVHAQDRAIKANVPFSFYAGSSEMPSGAYRVSEFSNGAVINLRAPNTSKLITTMAVTGKSMSEAPRMVFHRYGQVYFLAQVWTGGAANGRALVRTEREKELARSGATPALSVIRLALPK